MGPRWQPRTPPGGSVMPPSRLPESKVVCSPAGSQPGPNLVNEDEPCFLQAEEVLPGGPLPGSSAPAHSAERRPCPCPAISGLTRSERQKCPPYRGQGHGDPSGGSGSLAGGPAEEDRDEGTTDRCSRPCWAFAAATSEAPAGGGSRGPLLLGTDPWATAPRFLEPAGHACAVPLPGPFPGLTADQPGPVCVCSWLDGRPCELEGRPQRGPPWGTPQGTCRVRNVWPAFWPKVLLCVFLLYFLRPYWAQG